MVYVLVALGALVVLSVVFLWWRLTSVARGERQVGEQIAQILNPLAERLANRADVTSEEVAALARQPHVRTMLYLMLERCGRLDQFQCLLLPGGALRPEHRLSVRA
jgi:hypothetical protein